MSRGIATKLKTLMALPEFHLVATLFAAWDFEGFGLPAFVLRALRIPAAALCSIQLTKGISDVGDGGNGKSFLVYALRLLAGSYYSEVPMAMLTKEPPKSNECNPDLWALRGCRLAAAPEVENDQPVKASWAKRFSDSSVQWKAREPFGRRSVTFTIRCIFAICSNTKVEFTCKDGGVMRRFLGFLWPLKFVDGVPRPNSNERQKNTDLDTPSAMMPLLPSFLFVLIATAQAFFPAQRATFKQMPKCVVEATEELMHDEIADLIIEITNTWEECSFAQACTVQALQAAVVKYTSIKDLKAKACQVEVAVNRVFEKAMSNGRKNLAKRRSDQAYLKLP